MFVLAHIVRFRMLLTCCADHSVPPRAVGTRIRVNSAAIARSDLAPRAWMFSIIGRTVAAWRSASALTATTPRPRTPIHIGIAEFCATGLCSGEACFGPLRDQSAFLLGESGKQVQHEWVGIGA